MNLHVLYVLHTNSWKSNWTEPMVHSWKIIRVKLNKEFIIKSYLKKKNNDYFENYVACSYSLLFCETLKLPGWTWGGVTRCNSGNHIKSCAVTWCIFFIFLFLLFGLYLMESCITWKYYLAKQFGIATYTALGNVFFVL